MKVTATRVKAALMEAKASTIKIMPEQMKVELVLIKANKLKMKACVMRMKTRLTELFRPKVKLTKL